MTTHSTIVEFLCSPDWTEGEKQIILWQFNMSMGGFKRALFECIKQADGDNLNRLELGFPAEVQAYRSWAHGDLGDRLRAAGLGI